jgi:hypothetical protein
MPLGGRPAAEARSAGGGLAETMMFLVSNCGGFCRFSAFPAATPTPEAVDLNVWENLSRQPLLRTGKLAV